MIDRPFLFLLPIFFQWDDDYISLGIEPSVKYG